MSDAVNFEEDLCLWHLIQQKDQDRCQYVLDNCEVSSHVNYYYIYFCSINESNYIFMPIAVFITPIINSIDRFNVHMLLGVRVNS